MTESTYTIRKAFESDITQLTDLLVELFCIETDFKIDREKHSKGISLIIHNRAAAIIYIAEQEGAIVGMISGQIVISTAAGSYSVLLEDMIIRSSHRHSGIGTNLLDTLLLWAREKGAVRVQLVADRNNDSAFAFYQKQGFSRSRMEGMYKRI